MNPRLTWRMLSLFVGFRLATAVLAAEPVEPAEPTYRLQAGSVVAVRAGAMTRLGAVVHFADGASLSPAGVLHRADGSEARLVEGQTVTATGHLNPPPVATPSLPPVSADSPSEHPLHQTR